MRHHHEIEMEMIYVQRDIERLKKRLRKLSKEYRKARTHRLGADYVRREEQMYQ
jgi:hypothetical protein